MTPPRPLPRPPPIHECLQELHDCTPWTVSSCESHEMDRLLASLRTPAHQGLFVLRHAFWVCGGDMDAVSAHCGHLWKPNRVFPPHGLQLLLLQQQQQLESSTIRPDNGTLFRGGSGPQSSPKIVNAIVALQGSQNRPPTMTMHLLGQSLHHHLFVTLGTDLRNGAAADAALSLAMAGVDDSTTTPSSLFDVLAHIAAGELDRKRTKGGRRAVDILAVVEKLAAAGCRGRYMDRVSQAARESLAGSKGCQNLPANVLLDVEYGRMIPWSPRPLLWRWRRGHLLHKVSPRDLASSLRLEDLQQLQPPFQFEDPSLPLVVDVGCGLGVSLIGLCAASRSSIKDQTANGTNVNPNLQPPLDWSRCNYLGGDLSPAAIRWARAMARRWNVAGRCQFHHVSTDVLLDYLLQSKIHVTLILLQFPTPYRLQQEAKDDDSQESNPNNGCNLRLPVGPEDETFMANPKVLRGMVDLLRYSSDAKRRPSYLLMQSNCQDVALHLSDHLKDLGMESVPSDTPQSRESLASMIPTTRTEAWWKQQQRGGNHPIRRAVGSDWSAEPHLPVLTETEAACIHHGTPIHRGLFRVNCGI